MLTLSRGEQLHEVLANSWRGRISALDKRGGLKIDGFQSYQTPRLCPLYRSWKV